MPSSIPPRRTNVPRKVDAIEAEKAAFESKTAAAKAAAEVKAAAEKAAAEQAAAQFMAEHTVQPDETLSHIALKYYGSAVKAKWMVIYEANKETIGDNPNIIRPGQVLKIPVI